jgi:outer membrane protein OmpA-like peptidoglycan-associated protein
VKPEIVQQVVKQVVNNNVLQPTVIFGLGKSTVDAAQMASVAMIAKYMKNHPESRLLIKGFASPEGDPELNQRLSEKRAQSVKDVLVSRYGVSADRLEIKGMGATDELFDEVDFNRVATFTDLTK